MTENAVKYSRGYHLQLRDDAVFSSGITGFAVATEFVSLLPTGRICLRHGYATDGITCITGTPWEFLLSRPWLVNGSFPHDGIYQLIRLGLLPAKVKKQADEMLREVCVLGGADQWQADIVYRFVEHLGGLAGLEDGERPLLEAP